MQLDPGLPDRQKSGGQNGQQHIIPPDPQHWCTAGLRPQPTPVLPVHTRLYSYTQLQCHRQFSDDTTVIGLITDNDETAYREEVSTLTKWCQENHLSLNIDKTKELVVDYRRQSREHTPITIDKDTCGAVSSFKFLGVHITEDLTWSAHTECSAEEGTSASLLPETAEEVWNEPQNPQVLLHLHCGEHPDRLYHRLVWKQHRWQPQALQRVVRTARHIVGGELPSLQDIYTRRCTRESPEDYQRLQPPVPQTALSAALRATFPQHPIPH